MKCPAFLAAVFLLSNMAEADDPITVSINPEARVSVALTGTLPAPARCGSAFHLAVTVINQSQITARLEAALVDPAAGVTLDFESDPLQGLPVERRHLRLTLTRPEATDITVSFRAHNEMPDLGGRDRIHFLLRCQRGPGAPHGASS